MRKVKNRIPTIVLVLAGFASFAALGSAEARVRQDVESEFYLEGFLTWNAGQGRIAWSQAPSEDPAGPGADIAKDVYVSDPVPRTIHVNASRLIQLEIYTKDVPTDLTSGTSCKVTGDVTLGAELRTQGRILAGDDPESHTFLTTKSQGGKFQFPPPPPGWGVCRLRLGAEIGVLQQGNVITLRLTHHDSDSTFPLYGMAGDHRSLLRIPYFPAEEVAYRYPSYAHGAPRGPTTVGSELSQLLTALGVSGVAFFSTSRTPKRQRTLFIALVLSAFLLAGFAGCVGGPKRSQGSDDPEVEPPSVAPVYQEGDLSKRGFGSLIGQVRSAASAQAIQGAYVGLLGTPNATRTDPYGRFVFNDLEPGTYRLHVDHSGYDSFDGTVEVLANLIASVNISLSLFEVYNPDPNFNAHPHDYWGGKTERTLMQDEDLGVQDCSHGFYSCSDIREFRVPLPNSLSDYNSILPGTYEVNLTLQWDPQQMGYSEVRLYVQANNDPNPGNWTPYLSRPPGQPYHIATTWEMEDPGHQHFSTWTFKLFRVGAAAEPDTVGGAQRELAYVERSLFPGTIPTFSATVTIKKGVVGLEAAHPDPWAGRNSLEVLQSPMDDVGIWSAPNDDYLPSKPYTVANWWDNAWKPKNRIPAETASVEVFANASRDLVPPYGLELRYKTAVSGAPVVTCWNGSEEGGEECDSPDPGYQTVGAGVRSGTSTRWVIPVATDDPDPYYAVRSFWVFGVHPTPDEGTGAAVTLDYRLGGEIEYSLAVIAHRAPDGGP